jgi:hypothetical protein
MFLRGASRSNRSERFQLGSKSSPQTIEQLLRQTHVGWFQRNLSGDEVHESSGAQDPLRYLVWYLDAKGLLGAHDDFDTIETHDVYAPSVIAVESHVSSSRRRPMHGFGEQAVALPLGSPL